MKKASISALLLVSATSAVVSPSLSAASAGSNIALGKPVSASSNESAYLASEQAVDGNPETRWSSDFNDHNWIEVDLEARHELHGVTLHWQNSYSKDYDIKVSDDGENWTTLQSVTNSDGGVDDFSLSGLGRYVRIEGYDRATEWGHSLWEMEIQGELYVPEPVAPDDRNLALNKTVFTSSVESHELNPEQAVDGNPDTRWSSDFSDHNWITVDLGDRYALSAVNIHWQNSYSKDYDVKVSDDGNEWVTLSSMEDSDGGLDEVLLSGEGRYLRIEGYDRATEWGHSIWELEVLGHDIVVAPEPEPTPEPKEVVKVSEGKTAVASSVESPYLVADYAVDGDDQTRWSSQFRDNSWIYVDLEESHQIVEVKLFWQNSYSKDYEVQTSYNGVDWETIEQVENSDGGLDELSVSGHGRYLRVEGLRRATEWGHSLWELEVYGYATESQDSGDSTDTDTDTDEGDSGDSGDQSGGSETGGSEEVVDEQAPEVPSGLTVSIVDSSSVVIDWQQASDDTGVMSYQVYRNGAFLVEVMAPTTEVTDTGLEAGVRYSYTVRAGDEAGNWSDTGAADSVTLETEEVVVSGNIQLEWLTPDQRENGTYLELYEIGGYEIRYRATGSQNSETVVVDDPNATGYSLDLPEGSYEFSIAVYDTNGLYSEFVPLSPVQ